MGESYEIRLRGRLSERWREQFAPLQMSLVDGETLLRGAVADQGQLFGLLQRIRDLNCTLLSVQRLATTSATANPFLQIERPEAWGPGSLEMAQPLAHAVGIAPGMRVLEVGGGSGQVATTIAKHYQAEVVTPEPWTDGSAILAYAASQGVANRVLPLRLSAQSLPFPSGSFDAILSIGTFEMIGDERPLALQELIRVARPGARIGIAEPICLPVEMPDDLIVLDAQHNLAFRASFRTLDWNRQLFERHGLTVLEAHYFPEAPQWWQAYISASHISEGERAFIRRDQGRWLSLGLLVAMKPA